MREVEVPRRARPVALDLAVAQFGEVWGLDCLQWLLWPEFWVLYRRLDAVRALRRVDVARAVSIGFGAGDTGARQFRDDLREAELL